MAVPMGTFPQWMSSSRVQVSTVAGDVIVHYDGAELVVTRIDGDAQPRTLRIPDAAADSLEQLVGLTRTASETVWGPVST